MPVHVLWKYVGQLKLLCAYGVYNKDYFNKLCLIYHRITGVREQKVSITVTGYICPCFVSNPINNAAL